MSQRLAAAPWGSGLARESGVSVDIAVECAGPVSSEHKDCVRRGSNVGAGLPAKAVCQSTLMLNVPSPSRASPLPHSISSEHKD